MILNISTLIIDWLLQNWCFVSLSFSLCFIALISRTKFSKHLRNRKHFKHRHASTMSSAGLWKCYNYQYCKPCRWSQCCVVCDRWSDMQILRQMVKPCVQGIPHKIHWECVKHATCCQYWGVRFIEPHAYLCGIYDMTIEFFPVPPACVGVFASTINWSIVLTYTIPCSTRIL